MTAATPVSAGSDPAGALLAVTGLAKSYGRRRVLDAVRFKVRPGELLGLVGPNGAGKTTLFGCLSGVLPADAGEVAEGSGRALPPKARRALLFYLPDGILPWEDQTVDCALAGWRDLWRAEKTRARALVERLGLESLGTSLASALSKGERKRFLLALGLLTPQPLLLLDEPFDGLDLRQTRDVAALLREEAKGGRTLFLSIHQLVDAGRVCDRFVMLAAGRVAGEGTLPELRERAGLAGGSLEEVFLALT